MAALSTLSGREGARKFTESVVPASRCFDERGQTAFPGGTGTVQLPWRREAGTSQANLQRSGHFGIDLRDCFRQTLI